MLPGRSSHVLPIPWQPPRCHTGPEGTDTRWCPPQPCCWTRQGPKARSPHTSPVPNASGSRPSPSWAPSTSRRGSAGEPKPPWLHVAASAAGDQLCLLCAPEPGPQPRTGDSCCESQDTWRRHRRGHGTALPTPGCLCQRQPQHHGTHLLAQPPGTWTTGTGRGRAQPRCPAWPVTPPHTPPARQLHNAQRRLKPCSPSWSGSGHSAAPTSCPAWTSKATRQSRARVAQGLTLANPPWSPALSDHTAPTTRCALALWQHSIPTPHIIPLPLQCHSNLLPPHAPSPMARGSPAPSPCWQPPEERCGHPVVLVPVGQDKPPTPGPDTLPFATQGTATHVRLLSKPAPCTRRSRWPGQAQGAINSCQ